MPFTPFHFGVSAVIGLRAGRHFDLPALILINVAIDIEPLLVMVFSPNYPFHGYCHTFFGASLVAMVFAAVMYRCRNYTAKTMAALRLPYATDPVKIFFSSLLGAWLHVLIDAPNYPDIRPFFPYAANPLYGILRISAVYFWCSLFFIPALLLYLSRRRNLKYRGHKTT